MSFSSNSCRPGNYIVKLKIRSLLSTPVSKVTPQRRLTVNLPPNLDAFAAALEALIPGCQTQNRSWFHFVVAQPQHPTRNPKSLHHGSRNRGSRKLPPPLEKQQTQESNGSPSGRMESARRTTWRHGPQLALQSMIENRSQHPQRPSECISTLRVT